MADILLTCSSCGEETAVSEYIDPQMASCASCGEKLEVPEAYISAPQAPKKKPKQSTQAVLQERGRASVAKEISKRSERRKKKRRGVIVWTPSTTTIIVIFVIGVALLLFLRVLGLKTGVFSKSLHESYIQIGFYAVLILHVAVVVDAFNDSIMHGLLAIFVPFYGLYFLYFHCDSFVLRLIVAIFIVPFGLDTCKALLRIGFILVEWLRRFTGAW